MLFASLIFYLLSYLSRIQACANPPSAQAVNNAKRFSSRCSRLEAVVTNLAPVAPKGCPMEREPPNVFMIEKSNCPTGCPDAKRSETKQSGICLYSIYIYIYIVWCNNNTTTTWNICNKSSSSSSSTSSCCYKSIALKLFGDTTIRFKWSSCYFNIAQYILYIQYIYCI